MVYCSIEYGVPHPSCLDSIVYMMNSMNEAAFVSKDDFLTFGSVLAVELEKVKKDYPKCTAVLDTDMYNRIILRSSDGDDDSFHVMAIGTEVVKLMAYDQYQQRFVDRMDFAKYAAELTNERHCSMVLNVPKMAHDVEYHKWLFNRLLSLKNAKILPYLMAVWNTKN